jgi:Methyltransferase FkbM domain
MQTENGDNLEIVDSIELYELKYAKKYYSDALYNLNLKIEIFSEIANRPDLEDLTAFLSKHLRMSQSQILQDLLVAYLFRGKQGFFCEFGACDGKTMSNTYFLEKELGWSGIVCEPSGKWHEALFAFRDCSIDTKCVYEFSDQDVLFNETPDGLLSTISTYSNLDILAEARINGEEYAVGTITLEDLLRKHNAPNYIDFLSVDTEGSEWDILEVFDFGSFQFGAIFVEHNFGINRKKVSDLLIQAGYRQILLNHSRWDDWFISRNLYDQFPHLIH